MDDSNTSAGMPPAPPAPADRRHRRAPPAEPSPLPTPTARRLRTTRPDVAAPPSAAGAARAADRTASAPTAQPTTATTTRLRRSTPTSCPNRSARDASATPRRPTRRWCASPRSATPAPVRAGDAAARPRRRRQAGEPAAPGQRAPPPSRRRGSRKRRRGGGRPQPTTAASDTRPQRGGDGRPTAQADGQRKRRRGGRAKSAAPSQLDADLFEQRRGRERNGRPVGRYLMCVQVRPGMAQVAVLEGRSLIEHYVSRPADDVSQIHGNIYLGRVQNVLPGMEAAFVDIATPKNAVLYRGDVQYDRRTSSKGQVEQDNNARIEQMLRARQMIMCQVTKNPIGAKGARLTQEVSLPGRFVVLIPNSNTYGISKRLPDDERKRLRDDPRPGQARPARPDRAHRRRARHRRGARAPTCGCCSTSGPRSSARRRRRPSPALLYREPELAVRVIREEFNPDYRGVVIDDQRAVRARSATTSPRSTPSSPTGSSTTTPPPRGCRCSSASTSTSRCTRRSTARCGCRRAGR